MAISNTAAVTQLFEAIQYQAPDTADLNTFVALLNSGQATLQTIQTDIENAPFTINVVDPVIREYQAAFGRVPDQAGVAFWVGQVATNPAALTNLNVTFANSPEFAARYGGLTATSPGSVAFISALYENVLNRAPDAAGLNFWLNQNFKAAQLLQAFAQSAEFVTDMTTPILTFQNLEAAGTPPPPNVSIFSLTPNTVFLTTHADTVNGAQTVIGSLTPFFIDGVGPTLNIGDNLSNIGTLTIVDQNATGIDVIPVGVTLSAIQNISLQTQGNAGAGGAAFDTSTITGGTAGAITNVVADTIQSNGAGTDLVKAAGTTAVTINHNNVGGSVIEAGGSNVSVTSNGGGNASGIGVIVGSLQALPAIPGAGQLPTGNVTVTDSSTASSPVQVLGGKNISVTIGQPTNAGLGAVGGGFAPPPPPQVGVQIGNTALNTGDSLNGGATNPTGTVTVADAGNGNAVTVFGGTTVSITSAGDLSTGIGAAFVNAGNVTVGDAAAVVASNMPTGVVTVADMAPIAFDDLSTLPGQNIGASNVAVFGGSSVTVTTNDGSVTVGNPVGLPGTFTTGAVSVTDTANDAQNNVHPIAVSIVGGSTVAVSAADDAVNIGQGAPPTTGAVSVTETAATTAQDVSIAPAAITIDGGNGVTVTAEGQTVLVGTNAGTAGAQVVNQGLNAAGTAPGAGSVYTGAGLGGGNGKVTVDGGSTVAITTTGGNVTVGKAGAPTQLPSSSVTITDEFGAGNATNDAINVLGGAAVSITINSADKAAINVGGPAPGALNPAGTALLAPLLYPTGPVTIVDDQTNSGVTTFGKGPINIATDGSASVTIAGGTVQNIVDVNTTIATGGVGAGLPVGPTALTSVSLTGDQQAGVTAVKTNALAITATLLSSPNANLTVTDVNPGAQSALLTVGGDGTKATQSSFTDNTAATLSVTDNGVADANIFNLVVGAAGSITFSNSAAQSFAITDASLATITAKNTGSLNLGDISAQGALVGGVASVTATGAGVTVQLNPGVTSFLGSAGTAPDTVSLTQNAFGVGVTVAGAAGSTVVANYAAGKAAIATGLETDVSLGTNLALTGFTTLALGANAVSDAHTGAVFKAFVPTVQQTDVVTIAQGTFATGDFIEETINGTTVSATITSNAETPAAVAAALAGAITSAGIAGIAVSYTGGNNFFTLLGPVAGTPFTDVVATPVAATLTTPTPYAGVPTLTITGVAAGGSVGMTVNGTAYIAATVVGETAAQAAAAIAALINGDPNRVANAAAVGGVITLTPLAATTVAVSWTAGHTDAGFTTAPNTGAETLQADSIALTGTYVAGDVISGNINGKAYTYTVTAPDAASAVNAYAQLATDLAAAIHTQTGATTTTTAVTGTPITVTDTTHGATVDTSATTDLEPGIVSTPGVVGSAGDGYYDAAGFKFLTVGATAGDVTFKNVGAGVPLTITAAQGGGAIVNEIFAKAGGAATINLAPASPVVGVTSTVSVPGETAVTINSGGVGKEANTLTLGDSALSALTLTGTQALTLTLTDSTLLFGPLGIVPGVVTVNASGDTGAVTLIGIGTAATGNGITITGGGGLLTTSSTTLPGATAAIDSITVGTGGGVLTIGNGGAWNTTAKVATTPATFGAYDTGSETINLSAATVTAGAGPADQLVVGDNIISTFNSKAGGVTGFHAAASTAADQVLFAGVGTKTVIANQGTATTIATLAHATTMAAVLDPTGKLGADIADFSYTSSNGVITFVGNGTFQVPAAVSELIDAAEMIVSQTGNQVAEFVAAGATYIVSSDAANTLFNDAGSSTISPGPANNSSVIELIGQTTANGFGSSIVAGAVDAATAFGALNTISANVIEQVAPDLNAAAAAAKATFTYADTGFAQDTVNAGDQANGAGAASVTTFSNLAPAAILTVDGAAINNVVTTQTGANGTNSLDVVFRTASVVQSLTVNGDYGVDIQTNAGPNELGALIDGTGNLGTLLLTGANALQIDAITAASLTTINASTFGATLTLGGFAVSGAGIQEAPLAQNGLTILLDAGNGSTVTIAGTGDHITQVAAGAGNVNITATPGSTGDVFTLQSTAGGNAIVANGANETFNLGNTAATGAYAITAQGTGDIVTFTATHNTASTVTLGNGGTVTFGAGHEAITITNDLTGGTSASFVETVLQHVATGANETLTFANVNAANVTLTEGTVGGGFGTSLVNVASATTLAQALDLAASQAAAVENHNPTALTFNTLNANTGLLDWFQFQGNTYIVEAINPNGANAPHTALGAGDAVVKIVGLVDLSASAFNAATHTLTF